MARVKRVDYGRGCDFWLPCLPQLERLWARACTTLNPLTLAPQALLKSYVDDSFRATYTNWEDRLAAWVETVQVQVVSLPLGEETFEFYICLESYAFNIGNAVYFEGATHPCDYDCYAWVYAGMSGDNPL